ncbi:MAG: phage holin family protein [Chloroflexales bacterium]|nr:phage holin family protein [Chloroflexales bacterium]
MRLLIRWFITAIALMAAVWLVPGIEIRDNNGWVAALVMAAVLGLVNAFVRPLLTLLSCPLVLLTLGLFLLLINAFTLALSSWIAVNWFNVGFYVDGFFPSLFGSIVVSIVSFFLSVFLPDENEPHRVARA